MAIGAIKGDYDLILGIPFLSKFLLSVSISQQSIRCAHTGYELLDYRTLPVIKESVSINAPPAIAAVTSPENYLTGSSEMTVLSEFKDLFPDDIPAILDTNETDYKILDGSFPEKMQPEASRIRHKIVLTDPNAVVNERQYPYPQKHLMAWRTLLNQHIAAGRIRRSSSQYASPSLIIPKKDATALPRWVCDYCTLNSLTVRDRSPLPNLDEVVRLVAQGKVFSILDQTNAFFQTRMREADIPLTAVKTPWGLYEWRVMPMGLTNAPATHQA